MVLDRRVDTGIDQRLVVFAGPADDPRWRAAVTTDGDDLTSLLGNADVAAPDDDPVTDSCLHGDHLPRCLRGAWFPAPSYIRSGR